jgi:hypothetical protein
MISTQGDDDLEMGNMDFGEEEFVPLSPPMAMSMAAPLVLAAPTTTTTFSRTSNAKKAHRSHKSRKEVVDIEALTAQVQAMAAAAVAAEAAGIVSPSTPVFQQLHHMTSGKRASGRAFDFSEKSVSGGRDATATENVVAYSETVILPQTPKQTPSASSATDDNV